MTTPISGGSRKPPSQRNPEHKEALQSRALQSMSPGTLGGRFANASPVSASSTPPASGAGESGPVLYVSTAAEGPPTDGSVFWYVTDETC